MIHYPYLMMFKATLLTSLILTSLLATLIAGSEPKFPLQAIPESSKSQFLKRQAAPHVFVDPGYRIWGMAVIKWSDGKYHGYYARWPEKLGHNAWMTHCEIAHAVADKPEGPFTHVNTVLSSKHLEGWDVNNAHNPAICIADGKICLYYISNDLKKIYDKDPAKFYPDNQWFVKNRKALRNSQRIGVAIASSPEGPFERHPSPVVEPHGRFKNIAVNPAVTYQNGTFTMIMKGDDIRKDGWFRIQLVGHSSSPTGPFTFQPTPVYDRAQTEDAGIWYDQKDKTYYMACHVMGKRDLALFHSTDGNAWSMTAIPLFMKKQFRLGDGTIWNPARVERPFILTDDQGSPIMLYLAVADKNANGNIAVPFKK